MGRSRCNAAVEHHYSSFFELSSHYREPSTQLNSEKRALILADALQSRWHKVAVICGLCRGLTSESCIRFEIVFERSYAFRTSKMNILNWNYKAKTYSHLTGTDPGSRRYRGAPVVADRRRILGGHGGRIPCRLPADPRLGRFKCRTSSHLKLLFRGSLERPRKKEARRCTPGLGTATLVRTAVQFLIDPFTVLGFQGQYWMLIVVAMIAAYALFFVEDRWHNNRDWARSRKAVRDQGSKNTVSRSPCKCTSKQ